MLGQFQKIYFKGGDKIKHNSQLPNRLVSCLKRGKFCIFLFHGVITRNPYKIRNYTGKHIRADLFEKCLEALSNSGNSISMDDILYNYENKIDFPDYSYAITFDDGFENNISVAGKILNKFKIPATIYVTTTFIENNSISWIDKIECAVEYLPDGFILENSIFEERVALDNHEKKINFLNNIRQYVKNNKKINPDDFAEKLCKKLGFYKSFKSESQLDKKLSWEQLEAAQNNELITIGGHTHTHQILSFLNRKDLAYELDTSINLLKEKSNINLIHYSYPEGLSHCFSDEVISELKLRGIKCCPTAIEGYNDSQTSPFLLKRIMVG